MRSKRGNNRAGRPRPSASPRRRAVGAAVRRAVGDNVALGAVEEEMGPAACPQAFSMYWLGWWLSGWMHPCCLVIKTAGFRCVGLWFTCTPRTRTRVPGPGTIIQLYMMEAPLCTAGQPHRPGNHHVRDFPRAGLNLGDA